MIESKRFFAIVATVLGCVDPNDPPNQPSGVAAIEITPSVSSVEVGSTIQLRAIARDGNGAEVLGLPVTWSSSAPSAATVADGLVSGLSPGPTVITAQVDAVSATRGVAVVPCQVSGTLFLWPVCGDDRGRVSQDYAEFNGDGRNGMRYHAGFDIGADPGTAVIAVASGKARRINADASPANDANHLMGNVVILDRGDAPVAGARYSLYAHLQQISVEDGAQVTQGTLIGRVGKTGLGACAPPCGPHLHFETKNRGVYGSETDDKGPTWGYTGNDRMLNALNHPDKSEYEDPVIGLHATRAFSAGPRRVLITVAGDGMPILLGPGPYPASVESAKRGEEFLAVRTADATDSPKCSDGWFQIKKENDQHFAAATAPGSLPDGWICRGNAGSRWVQPLRIFAASISGTLSVADPPSDLFSIDASVKGTDRPLGRVHTVSGFEPAVTDLALAPDGHLWAISFTRLYLIDTLSATATDIGSLGASGVNGLAVDGDGDLYASTYLSGQLLSINTTTGAATPRGGPFGNGLVSYGDLAFAPDGRLFAILRSSSGRSILATVSLTTGLATPVSPGVDMGSYFVWGLSFVGDRLFGVTWDPIGRGVLVEVGLTSGRATAVRALSFNAGGSGAESPQRTVPRR